MPEEIYQIIYGSAARTCYSKEELISLLKVSRRNNARASITGALFYKDGNFLQVLEGPKENVRKLYDVIKVDPKHVCVIPYMERVVEKRDFPDWKMAFYDFSNQLEEIPEGYSDFLSSPDFPQELQEYPEKLRPFLRLYSRDLI